jgi:hypothetical protein
MEGRGRATAKAKAGGRNVVYVATRLALQHLAHGESLVLFLVSSLFSSMYALERNGRALAEGGRELHCRRCFRGLR